MKSQRIGVLYGGLSSEAEVSQKSGLAVVEALVARGWNAVGIFVDSDLDMTLRQEAIDVAFLALHGRFGEDGCVQGLLELRGIPYTGSSVLASALAMDKAKAKELFRLANLPTPQYLSISADEDGVAALLGQASDARSGGGFGVPCVIKPRREGSSLGVTVCRDRHTVAHAVQVAGAFDDELIAERLITGMEITVAIVGDRTLGAAEVARSGDWFDYGAKHKAADSRFFLPPRLSPAAYRMVLGQALRAHRALGCCGATSVDLLVTPGGNEYILEVNTLPGMAPTALVPRIAAASGISYPELCEMMLLGASLKTGKRRHHAAIAPQPLRHGVHAH